MDEDAPASPVPLLDPGLTSEELAWLVEDQGLSVPEAEAQIKALTNLLGEQPPWLCLTALTLLCLRSIGGVGVRSEVEV